MNTASRFLILAAFSASALAAPPHPAAAPGNPPAGHPAMGSASGAGGASPAMPAGHGGIGGAQSPAEAPLAKKGKVLTVLDAKQFTYVEVQDGKAKPMWVVAPALAVKPGATVKYADGEVMAKFHSKSLNRDFTNVLFTTRMVVDK